MATITLRHGERTVPVQVGAADQVRIGDESYTVTEAAPGLYLVSNGATRWQVAVADSGDTRWVSVNGQVAVFDVETRQSQGTRKKTARADAMMAPMPATVAKLLVAPGQAVAEGETVLVLEAMKMELSVRSPRAGVVKAVHCAPGELVQPGVALVDLE
jgi:biotin carboxyl carrier protein